MYLVISAAMRANKIPPAKMATPPSHPIPLPQAPSIKNPKMPKSLMIMRKPKNASGESAYGHCCRIIQPVAQNYHQ
jgi:hypothetical protein